MMGRINWTWAIPIVVFCMALVAGLVFFAVIADDGDDYKLFQPLFSFCWDQLQSEVDNCSDWAFLFEDIYGDAAAECLENLDSDSPVLLICMDLVVTGR